MHDPNNFYALPVVADGAETTPAVRIPLADLEAGGKPLPGLATRGKTAATVDQALVDAFKRVLKVATGKLAALLAAA